MANPMKREGLLPQLWICFAIYTSVVLAHDAPLARLAGDSDECSCSMRDPLIYIAGGIWADAYGQTVVNEFTKDAVRDLQQLNKKREQETSDMQSKLTQTENELKTAKLKWADEKRDLTISFKKKELLLRDEIGKERDQYKAYLASCQSRQRDMVTVEACDIKKHEALTECEEKHHKCAADLEYIGVRGSSRDLETRPSSCLENAYLQQELSRCRAEKYEAQAMLAVRPEGQDAAKTNWLPVCLVVVFVMACFLIPVAAQSGWWTSPVKGGNEKSSPSTQPQVLSGEEAQTILVNMFKPEGKEVSSILTSPVASGSEGRGYIFMLVPVNVNASRNLALFGGGGCYTRQVEVARECARNKGKTLVIVLYRFGGHALTGHDMQMSAEELVSKATPRDQDFPRERDILVIWKGGSDDLQVIGSGGTSKLSEIVKRQPWARHLGRGS